ncbi:MAG: hypothetical protein ACFB10_00265 [Salibacteraceae bacterium]
MPTFLSEVREKIVFAIFRSIQPFYFLSRFKRQPWNLSTEDLSQFPKASLGHDLYLFLTRNQLQLLPRAEFHDTYHVLFEYGTTMKEETCGQFITLGNGKKSLANLTCVGIALFFYPEEWTNFQRAYQTGKQALPFHKWDMKRHLSTPTATLRQLIFQEEPSEPLSYEVLQGPENSIERA